MTLVQVDHAQRTYWDAYYRGLGERGSDLDWGGRWTAAFLPLLRAAGARDVLELGCGTGNDAARLAREGLHVVATDLSTEAVAAAQQKFGDLVDVRVVDMAAGLPFAEASFDAVMANVALHMFTDAVTRAVFADVRRVLREGRAVPLPRQRARRPPAPGALAARPARVGARLRIGGGWPDGPLLLTALSG